MKHPIILIVSSDAEWNVISSMFHPDEINTGPYGEWFEHPNSLGQVLFMQGGWGKIAAAASAQYAIDRWEPACLVNFGTCGGFHGHVELGEIIIATGTVVYDMKVLIGSQEEEERHYTTESPSLPVRWAEEHSGWRTGIIASGDRDLEADRIDELHDRFGAIAADWESASIAYVASRNGTPYLIVRGVSDVVGGQDVEVAGTSEHYSDYLVGVRLVVSRILDRLLDSLRGLKHAIEADPSESRRTRDGQRDGSADL